MNTQPLHSHLLKNKLFFSLKKVIIIFLLV